MQSTVPGAQDALVELLAAEFPDAHVQFGLPTKVPRKRERLYVIDEQDFRRRREAAFTTEEYRLRVVIEVAQPAPQTGKACSDRRWELVDALEEIVRDGFRAHLSAGDGVAAVDSTLAPTDNGFVAHSIVQIAVTRRG